MRRDIDAQRFDLPERNCLPASTTKHGVALKQAINESFVFGFRLVMLTSLCLALASALVAFMVIENK